MQTQDRLWAGRRWVGRYGPGMRWTAVVLVVLALILAACGRRETPTPAPSPTTEQAPAAETPAGETPDETPVEGGEDQVGEAEAAEAEEATPSAFESPLQAESPLAAPESPLPTPVSVSSQDLGVFVGQVFSNNLPGNPPLAGQGVRLGPVFWNDDESDGTFVIDGAHSPGAYIADDGTFVIADLPPGDYVLVVGDLMGHNEVVKTEDGKAKVFTAEAGKLTDLGVIRVDLPKQ